MDQTGDDQAGRRGNAGEVFLAFLVLGLTAFGGPVAHLGYFRHAFVVRRGWLGEAAYADLVALCQFLPGPASSQVGMAIGLHRAGAAGMLAAWVGFTLPSAVAMTLFALGLAAFGVDMQAGWIAGLKTAAVAVVAHALLGMARGLAPDVPRRAVALFGMVVALLVPGSLGQLAVIALAALAGLTLLAAPPAESEGTALDIRVAPWVSVACLVLFFVLLAGLPLAAGAGLVPALVDGVYRAGSLVFGGGHVVLPLLEAETVARGLLTREAFLAGYGAVQAVPGPLFTFAAYLGAMSAVPPTGVAGAVVATLVIFLPSALLLLAGLPLWARLRAAPPARRALAGINAGVVGLLGAALYDPVFLAGVTSPLTMALAVLALGALFRGVPPWAVVAGAGLAGALVL